MLDQPPTAQTPSAFPVPLAPPALHTFTPAQELVHSFKNCLFAMMCGLRALEATRKDEDQFKNIRAAMNRQLELLEGHIAETARMLRP